ncbi:MAG TPA: PAS domain S-box protein [Anaerolineales bacterium]|nr:PAS domain S-box protein [Anaerolineales bacterium]
METKSTDNRRVSQIKDDLPLGEESTASHTKREQHTREHFSHLRLLFVLILSIFLAEVAAMILIFELPPLPYQYMTLIDAGTMVILIFPGLYYLSFRPLVRHIEKRQQAEERLRLVNRALSVLNECNQVLVRTDQEHELLQQMCEIIVITGQYRMAWVGFAEQDKAKSIHPAAQVGFEEGYLDSAQISWADNERGRGPTGTAVRTGVVQVNQNFLTNPIMAPWRESAVLRDYQSSIALPLKDGKATFGALTIYSALPEAFDKEEVRLLTELANDLAFGITALRVRAERNRAQEQVREMALFPAHNPDAVIRVDPGGQVNIANPAAEGIGLCVGAQLTDIISDLSDLDLAACIATGATQQIPETHLGERVLQWTIHGAPDLGLAFLYSTDITLRKQAEDLNRQLSRIVEQTEDTVVVTNRDGVIEYVNPAFERLTGYAKEEALGQTPRVLKSGLHDNEFYRELWNTILKGDVFQSEIANRKKNGDLYHEVKTITPLRDAQDTITHFVATGKDITQHKLDEERLLEAYDELERRVQERTEELRIANSKLEEDIIERRHAEAALQAANAELRRFNQAMVGRELRMIELKKEVNELCESTSQPQRYLLAFDND